MARTTSTYPGSIDVFTNATTDFNPGDAIPSSDFERGIDAIKTIQTKLGITGGTTLLDGAVTINNSEADKDFRVAAVGVTNALFVQGSDGKVGIGTAVVPHGGVGYAMLALDGANASATGPHIQTTTATDDYPVLQILSWAHDNFVICIDSYYEAGEKSSDAGSNIRIIKQADLFKIQYDSGVAQGGAITWNDGIALNTSGGVGIGTAVVPHGGVGYAMLALDGANASATGPHIQTTTATDDYPVLQILSWAHDNFLMYIDSYYEGGDKSSDAGSNIRIIKQADIFKLQYDSGVAQGGAITWNDGIELAIDGGIFFDNLLQQTAVGLVVEYNAGTGEIYAETSAKKFKKNIRPLEVDTSRLLDLTPKSYTDKETGRKEFGLIAEEVASIIPELVVFDTKKEPLGIKYTSLTIALLNEIKRLNENNHN